MLNALLRIIMEIVCSGRFAVSQNIIIIFVCVGGGGSMKTYIPSYILMRLGWEGRDNQKRCEEN